MQIFKKRGIILLLINEAFEGENMYIWVAIDVDEQLNMLRKNAESYVQDKGLYSPTLTLPFHISLKISFNISNDIFQGVLDDIRELLKALTPFEIITNDIEEHDGIIWLTMQDNEWLIYIHNKLDEMLFEKYGVEQHEFDKNFIFHTSILILNNEEESKNAFNAIQVIKMPKILKVERFIIGSSINGVAGTYSVNEKIEI